MAKPPFYKRVGQFIHQRPRLERWLDRIIHPFEAATKKVAFGCQMCGQCVLHSTGMTCPMTCPKDLRNGPCGGVDMDGRCEVEPSMTCIWVNAFHRSQRLPWPEEIHDLRPPVDWTLQDSSSRINLITERDQVTSGCITEPRSALDMVADNDKTS